MTENWHTWYIGGVDFQSRLRFLKLRPQNPFLGKFGPKNSKLFVLSENWYTLYLKDADPESGLRFLKFRHQNSFLGKFWSEKSKLFVFLEKIVLSFRKRFSKHLLFTTFSLFLKVSEVCNISKKC